MTTTRPVWGADVPISMPLPPADGEDILVPMYGFGMTQYRLVHDLTQTEYQALQVPVFAPQDPAMPVIRDDAAIDGAGPPTGSP